MNLRELLRRAEQRLASVQARLRVAEDGLLALRSLPEGDPGMTVEAVTEAREARNAVREEVTAVEADIADLRADIAEEDRIAAEQARTSPNDETRTARTGGATIGHEPTTYERGGRQSYFRDAAIVELNRAGRHEAQQRLERSAQETRALTTVDGAGGDFVPPLWLVNQFVELARAGRVVADQIAQQPLPGGTDTIALPRLATGTAVAEQATQNTAVQNTDATTGSVSATVATIAGQQVISVQLLEQSPINMDDVLLGDLAADYAIKLDTFVINNNAAGKLGLLNVSGVNAVTYTDASPTPGELYSKVADAIQQIHTGRFMPGDKIFMHPRRWAWFLAALDTAGRPLVVPSDGAYNAIAAQSGVVSQGFVGTLQGLPVYVDPNIPITLGGGTEDRVIVVRSTDSILYEGNARSEVFRETKADQLSVLLRFYNYAAIHASRLPKSISIISGTGLVTPVF